MNEKNELKILPINRTVIFSSLIKYKSNLVRTGVINEDKNSFIHSILSAASKEYYDCDTKDRINFLSKFCKNTFTKKEWKNSELEYLSFYKNINNCILNLYDFIKKISLNENNIDEVSKIKNKIIIKIIKNVIIKNINLYDLMVDLIPLTDVKKIIFKKINNNNSIHQYKKYIINNLDKYLTSLEILKKTDVKRAEFIKDTIINLIKIILTENEDDIFRNSYNYVKCNVDNLNIISDVLKYNIYFIDSETRLPFIFDKKQKYNNDKSIVILKINNNYEVIGKLMERNKIKREFNNDDELIIQINLNFNKKLQEDDKKIEDNNDNKNVDNINKHEKVNNSEDKEVHKHEIEKVDHDKEKVDEKDIEYKEDNKDDKEKVDKIDKEDNEDKEHDDKEDDDKEDDDKEDNEYNEEDDDDNEDDQDNDEDNDDNDDEDNDDDEDNEDNDEDNDDEDNDDEDNDDEDNDDEDKDDEDNDDEDQDNEDNEDNENDKDDEYIKKYILNYDGK